MFAKASIVELPIVGGLDDTALKAALGRWCPEWPDAVEISLVAYNDVVALQPIDSVDMREQFVTFFSRRTDPECSIVDRLAMRFLGIGKLPVCIVDCKPMGADVCETISSVISLSSTISPSSISLMACARGFPARKKKENVRTPATEKKFTDIDIYL